MATNPVPNPVKIEHVPAAANDPAILSVRGVGEPTPWDASVEPPCPERRSHEDVQWETFLRFPGLFEAHIVAGRLNCEGVPTVLLSRLGVGLADAAEILVPRFLMHRARWVMAWPVVPDEELLFLATGEIGPAPGDR